MFLRKYYIFHDRDITSEKKSNICFKVDLKTTHIMRARENKVLCVWDGI